MAGSLELSVRHVDATVRDAVGLVVALSTTSDGISEFRLCGKRATAAELRATAVHSCQKCTGNPTDSLQDQSQGHIS